MTITVNTDSYISVSDADTYFESRLYADSWDNATTSEKEKALKMATKKIDRQPIRGIKAVSTQTLEFPRALKTDYSRQELPVLNTLLNSDWLVETDVSQAVKDATCEEALALLKGIPKRQELQNQGVKSFSVDSISETYKGGTLRLISQEAREFLNPYLSGGFSIC